MSAAKERTHGCPINSKAFLLSIKEWPADNVERRPIADLIPYVNNARTHSDEQVAQIAASMKEWGWTNPVLIDDAGKISQASKPRLNLQARHSQRYPHKGFRRPHNGPTKEQGRKAVI